MQTTETAYANAALAITGTVADACHELKTPLTIVMGYLEAIGSGLIDDPQHAYQILERTRGECRRMGKTIARLAALARLDAPSETIESFDAAALACDVVESMRALSPDVHIDIPFTGETLVRGNRDDLREAVVIAIDNALKYAPGAPVDVRVTRFGSDIMIEVSDAGPGMSPEERERAFERFHRGSSHASIDGSGLGLAIAKRAVERAGGRIVLLSALGHGTTVRMIIPRTASRASASVHAEHRAPKTTPSGSMVQTR